MHYFPICIVLLDMIGYHIVITFPLLHMYLAVSS